MPPTHTYGSLFRLDGSGTGDTPSAPSRKCAFLPPRTGQELQTALQVLQLRRNLVICMFETHAGSHALMSSRRPVSAYKRIGQSFAGHTS
eukprot:3717940-Prymnesium_polylepis.1